MLLRELPRGLAEAAAPVRDAYDTRLFVRRWLEWRAVGKGGRHRQLAAARGNVLTGERAGPVHHGAHFHFITVPNATVVLNIGLISVGATLILSLLTQATAATTSIGPVPITLALIALIVGIPHGAVDNLTLTRGLTTRQRLIGVTAYVSIAGAAALCIVQWPGMAFLAVLGMTVWHFGTGDVEATRELQNLAPLSGLPRIAYALALGSAPVLLPLTSPAAVSTLTASCKRFSSSTLISKASWSSFFSAV